MKETLESLQGCSRWVAWLSSCLTPVALAAALTACGGGAGDGSAAATTTGSGTNGGSTADGQTNSTGAPTITGQPANQTVSLGSRATFVVTATGTDLSYQWKEQRTGESSFSDIPGATSATYITPATTSDEPNEEFEVVVTDAGGSTTSAVASLAIASSSPSTAAQCIDAALFQNTGYGFTLVQGSSSSPDYNVTIKGQTMGMASFNGEVGEEIDTTANIVEPGGITSTVATKTYAYLDRGQNLVTNYGSTEIATTVVNGQTTEAEVDSTYMPAWVDHTYSLVQGVAFTNPPANLTVTTRPIVDGNTLQGTTTTSSSTETVTFTGIETVTVPAGTFQACRFDYVSGTAAALSQSSHWQRLGDGIEVKALLPGGVTTYAVAITTTGTP